jgi:hypothetical protein
MRIVRSAVYRPWWTMLQLFNARNFKIACHDRCMAEVMLPTCEMAFARLIE